jgi:replicative DNA helicase
MYGAGKPVDLITVQQVLKDKQQLEGVGGLAYLASLPDAVPSAANLDYYLEIVREKHVLRMMIGTCTEVVSRAYDHQGEVDELIEKAAADVMEIVKPSGKQAISTMKVLVPLALEHLNKMSTNAGKVTGLPTGFIDLDMLTWGLQPSEMIVLAARPSQGKTSLAMNIGEYVAIHEGLPVGVFSMEMASEALMVRMLCSRAHVSTSAIRQGFTSENDQQRLTSSGLAFNKAPIYIDDSSALSVIQLRARAERMQKQHGIKLFIIDYLQLMNAPLRRSDNRQNEVSNISGGLKAMAKDLKVPVLVLSQLSRKLEDRGANAEPRLSDLRESGSIEQDADCVILLHRNKSNEDGVYQEAQPVTAIVAKNRTGPTGEADLVFLRHFTRFENAAKVTAEDVADAQKEMFDAQ